MMSPEVTLNGRRIALLIAEGYHEHEFWFPYYRLREAGAEVVVAGPELGSVRGEGPSGRDGLPAEVTHTVEQAAGMRPDAVYLPGGIYGPLRLRAHEPTLALVREAMRRGVVVAAICHAQWILVSAGVVRGRKLTGPPDMAVDITNAGGDYQKARAVRDGNLITAVYFGYLPEQFSLLMPALGESPPDPTCQQIVP
jgi:protease I